MPGTSLEELNSQFTAVLAKGDEQAAKDFLIDHIKEFPEDMQKGIVLAFAEEALEQKSEEAEAITTFQENALHELELLKGLQVDLERKLKMAEIKEDL